MKAKPFLKWAGGKTQLLTQFEDFYPTELRQRKIKNYVEPFIGGGAVFFELVQRYRFDSVYISDINEDLIFAYQAIQQNCKELLELLKFYQEKFDKTIQENRTELFLEIREQFNVKQTENKLERIAQMIFLNKTCFNGLYRLNSKGGFNVPFGGYKTAKIFDEANFNAISKILQNVEIVCADYKESVHKIDKNTFVYLDPPYRPISKTASFSAYTGLEFTNSHQIELAEFYEKISQKGAKVMLSNSDPKNENEEDHFFEETYKNFKIDRVSATRMINCNAEKRGAIKEVLIKNYQYEPRTLEFNF